MNALFLICLGIIIVVLLTDFLLIVFINFNFKSYQPAENFEPKISILVAARNEEDTIENCLESLLKLDYPTEKYEILVGDDMSSDGTAEVVQHWVEQSDNIQLHCLNEDIQYSKGKANVLAYLAKKAKGELFFITDADCKVNPMWLRGLLSAYDENVGISVGITDVNSPWQSMDWLFALGTIKALDDLNIPVVAMGNNMFISRKAYEAVGGYESIPFSVTEDLELFKQVQKKGYKSKHVVSPESLVITNGTESLIKLLRQRKRWLTGALQLNPVIVLLLFMQAWYYPAIVILIFFKLPLALILFLTKGIFQAIVVFKVSQSIKKPKSLSYLALFEFYQTYMAVVSSFYYLIPQPVMWKGRKY